MTTHTYYYEDWDTIPCEIIDRTIDGTGHSAVILKVGEYTVTSWSVWWSDGVANDWTEFYPTLSLALARTALLVHLSEHDFEQMFTSDADEFAGHATEFLKGESS
jgi:hypothetical protein